MKHALSMLNVLCVCIIEGARILPSSAFALRGSVSRVGHAEELAIHHRPGCA